MELLVDTSVIIAVIANEPEKESLVRLTAGATLAAPHSVHWEVGNAFSAMLRRKRITLAQALSAIEQYEKIPIRWLEPGLNGALAIAETANIYAYDAYLIQSALEHHIPLISNGRASDRGDGMTTYSLTEARRNLAALLEQAAKEGEIRIVGRDGQVFVLKPDVTARSPLDVQGVDLGLTTDEVIAFIREGRRSRDSES